MPCAPSSPPCVRRVPPPLYAAAERFDGVAPPRLRVPAEVIAAALETLDPAVRAALEESIRRARLVHADQRRTDTTTAVTDGGTVTERWVPVDRVGLYVPGGLAVYPSSVVMNVVPAQLAGVPSLAVASPPQADHGGWPHPTILAACALLGVDEVWAMGGAQAVAAFAYGVEDGADVCDPVSLVTGPGNIYVAAAKRLLKGVIGIDAEAGPTEIAVLADDSADAEHVASDLVSQAEHDPLAAAVLVTDSPELADAVEAALVRRVAATKHTERVSTALAGTQSAIVLVDDVDAGLDLVNAYAAEHLEIQTRDAAAVAARVRNAGAVFVGAWSPVSLGDYCAGVEPRAAHRWVRVPQQRAVGAVVPARHPRRHLLGRRAARGRRARRHPGAGRGPPGPRRGRARPPPRDRPGVVTRATGTSLTMDPRSAIEAMLRPDLRGRTAYGAPQLDVPVALNTNENSYPVPPVVVAAMTAARGRGGRRAQPLPRPRVHRTARGAGRLPVAQRHRGDARAGLGGQRLATRCSCTCSRRSAGPGRTALGFTPAYSMHPIITTTTGTAWVDGMRGVAGGGAFDLDAASAVEQVRAHRTGRRLPLLPEQPDRHRPGPRRRRGGARRRRGRAGRRRRGLRRVRAAGHPERADPARRAARGSWSPAR